MKVLFDNNVVLDHLLDRAPHADNAERLLNLVDHGLRGLRGCRPALGGLQRRRGRNRDSQMARTSHGQLFASSIPPSCSRPYRPTRSRGWHAGQRATCGSIARYLYFLFDQAAPGRPRRWCGWGRSRAL